MNGAERIAAERQRQIEKEGWTPEHDAEHADGQLARAAACYVEITFDRHVSHDWPWDLRWWKPSKRKIRNLEKAGALIAAEIDRLQLEGDE
jgi:hypothetical protein